MKVTIYEITAIHDEVIATMEMSIVDAKAYLDLVKEIGYGYGYIFNNAALGKDELDIFVREEAE